jgi:hypothetical protein
MANWEKISVWPLLERARLLRRDSARLVRRLRKTSEEITARDPAATDSPKKEGPRTSKKR